MGSRIILVSGYAASGKTHVAKQLARKLACCYFDKDVITGPLADRLLVALGQPAGDRDSDTYQREVRPLEYECLLAAGLEAAQASVTVVLSAPFICQVVDANWMDALERESRLREFELRIVWISCNRERLFQRMVMRGSVRDQAKITDWATYSASIDKQFHKRIYGDCFVFDNTDDARYDDELNRLIAYLSSKDRPLSNFRSRRP